MSILQDVFFTFVIALGIVYALGGLVGGLFLGEGRSGVWASARSFGLGAVAAGLLVALVTLVDLRMGPEAALLFPVLAAGTGGYLLGRYLEKREEEED